MKIQLTRPQSKFVLSSAKFPALIGGLGSGKSQGGTYRVVKLMLEDVGINCAYYFPTYDLISLRGITGLCADLETFGIDYTINKSNYTVTLHDYGDVIFRSYDNPARIVAYEVAHSIVDELDTLPRDKAEYVWRKVVERNRQKCNHEHGNTVGCVTTPDQGENGFVYEKWGKELQDGYELIKASTYSNPFLPIDYADNILKNYNPILARLYLEGEFVNLNGLSFFSLDKMLVNNLPVKYPVFCTSIIVVLDTAVKDKKNSDATAAIYCAYVQIPEPQLIILDYELLKIEGASLINWIPSVYARAEQLAGQCKAGNGKLVYIEDKASGSILLQQIRNGGLQGVDEAARPIPEKFVSLGKTERAISVSGHYYHEKLKISEYAYNKTINLNGITKNHLIAQITGFMLGIDAGAASDDALDCAVYSLLLAFGKI